MSLPISTDLILFVAGEPESTPSLHNSNVGSLSHLAGFMLGRLAMPPSSSGSAPGASSPTPSSPGASPLEEAPWHLPPQQVTCENLVVEVARQRQKTVLVIDVNRPEGQQALIEQWLRPNDVIPLLVRTDGARLDGAENFTPARVRKFVAGR